MGNVKLNTGASVLILAGILLAVVSLFAALWQNHPDPSAVSPGDIPGLKLTFTEGDWVFECKETGDVLPVSEAPAEIVEGSESGHMKFLEEEAFFSGKFELPVLYPMLLGGLLIVGGAVFIRKRRG